MQISRGNVVDYPKINILDTISFYKNQSGSNSFKLGNTDKYVLLTDNGDVSVKGNSSIILGDSNTGVDFTVYSSITANFFGNLAVSGNVWASNLSSDRRIKRNIKNSTEKAIDIIKKIKHRQYDMKEDGKHYNIGFIAQEIEEIDPNFVSKREKTDRLEERYYINVLPLIATATKAVQEQQEQIEQLQEKEKQKDEIIRDLLKRVETLEKEVAK